MNTEANAISELEGRPGPPAVTAATQPLYWSIRRELWENRSIYAAPLIAAGVYLLGFVITLGHLPARMRAALQLDPVKQHQAIVMPFDYAAAVVMGVALIVAIFYCLEALHGERRDRSILFWKSLPVSDLTTVMSKASVPLVIVPIVAFGITLVTHLIMLLLSSAVLAANGVNVSTMWMQVAFLQMSLLLLYHLFTVHSLWWSPLYAWLLLVSSWARRATFLWAVLPPLAIGILERVIFNTSHFAALMQYRFAGGPEAMTMSHEDLPIHAGTHLTPGRFLASPGLWIGLIVAAACLWGAARLRRTRGPI